MALKNTYAKLGAGRYLQDAQEALIKAGATSIQLGFDSGRVTSLTFAIDLQGNPIHFRLPVKWQSFQNVLMNERNPRASDDEYCYKVAWACTKDWIEAQMAFIESENATLAQVFLPYAVTKQGVTLYEHVASNGGQLLLGN